LALTILSSIVIIYAVGVIVLELCIT
jgi:hypothetical protein